MTGFAWMAAGVKTSVARLDQPTHHDIGTMGRIVMKHIFSAALVICAVAMTAQAQSVSGTSGNTLYERCRDGASPQLEAWCLGYMDGARDAVSLAHGPICLSPKVTNIQIRDVVRRTLRELPSTRHEQAWALITIALAKAWPCP